MNAIPLRRLHPIEPAPLALMAGDWREADASLLHVLMDGLSAGHVGLCLCDADDLIRYANDAFLDAFMPGMSLDRPVEFMDAIANAIRERRGINLQSLTLDRFVAVVRDRRRTAPKRLDFAVDLVDGRWFWVNDHKLPNGWMLVVASDITKIKGEELQLKRDHAMAVEAARTDFLTGLPNRRHGIERAEAALAAARGTGAPLSVAMLDLDHFKAINDRHGHEVGDRVLVHFAQRASELLGPCDQISRMGGEEFMLTLPGATPGEALSLLNRLIDIEGAVRRQPPTPYTVSAGIAAATAGASLQDLLDRADTALYRAKANGRGRVEVNVA